MLGKKVGTNLYDPALRTRLMADYREQGRLRATTEETILGNQYLNTLWLIENEEKCHRCHGAEKPLLGSMLVRVGTNRAHEAILRSTRRNLVFALLGALMICATTYWLVVKLITRPVKKLARGMRELPKTLTGEEVTTEPRSFRTDEIGCLEKAFFQMREDLREKNRLIEHVNEDLVAANRELESFAYSVSHDLRAPLRNIDGFSRILLDKYGPELDETATHYLNRVRNGAIKMSDLIDDMLSFSRASRAEMRPQEADTNTLVNDALRDFVEVVKERNIEVKVQELPRIVCDSVMMRHVFSNLLSNSFKYTRGSRNPLVLVGYDASQAAIFVRDNGIGFDMAFEEKIFQVFERLHLPEDYEGTGIGLALVRRIVERHRGRIWAESEPDRETTFYVHLPGLENIA